MGDQLAGIPLCCVFAGTNLVLRIWSQDTSEKQVGTNRALKRRVLAIQAETAPFRDRSPTVILVY